MGDFSCGDSMDIGKDFPSLNACPLLIIPAICPIVSSGRGETAGQSMLVVGSAKWSLALVATSGDEDCRLLRT